MAFRTSMWPPSRSSSVRGDLNGRPSTQGCVVPMLVGSSLSRLCLAPRPARALQRHGAAGAFSSRAQASKGDTGPRLDNLELLIGDVLCLVSFATYKQIGAIALSPDFPGWLAPLHLNPVRLAEFLSFSSTLTLTWVGCALILGGYAGSATADVPTALRRTCAAWLCSMPVAAAQLVLLTAAEDGALVGSAGFATALPLAASGPGEPFATAAGVLGVMCAWRAYYTTFLCISNFWEDRRQQLLHLAESAAAAAVLSAAGCLVLAALTWEAREGSVRSALDSLAAAWPYTPLP